MDGDMDPSSCRYPQTLPVSKIWEVGWNPGSLLGTNWSLFAYVEAPNPHGMVPTLTPNMYTRCLTTFICNGWGYGSVIMTLSPHIAGPDLGDFLCLAGLLFIYLEILLILIHWVRKASLNGLLRWGITFCWIQILDCAFSSTCIDPKGLSLNTLAPLMSTMRLRPWMWSWGKIKYAQRWRERILFTCGVKKIIFDTIPLEAITVSSSPSAARESWLFQGLIGTQYMNGWKPLTVVNYISQ